MMRGEDDAGEVKVASPVMRRWWRSVGFWLGLPGLVFLVWVWGDSFWHGSYVGAQHRMGRMGASAPFSPWTVRLHRGSVSYHRSQVVGAAPGVALSEDGMAWRWRGQDMSKGLAPLWGSATAVNRWWPWASLEVRWWWFSFGFVVLGYGVVWVGTLVICRRRMRRRWEKAQVVEG